MTTATLIGLLFMPAVIATGQILFKLASRNATGADVAGLLSLARDPYFVAALCIYGLGTLLWIYILKSVPLVLAYPFMALSFCFVPVLSYLLLGETISWRYGAGVALILVGLVIAQG